METGELTRKRKTVAQSPAVPPKKADTQIIEEFSTQESSPAPTPSLSPAVTRPKTTLKSLRADLRSFLLRKQRFIDSEKSYNDICSLKMANGEYTLKPLGPFIWFACLDFSIWCKLAAALFKRNCPVTHLSSPSIPEAIRHEIRDLRCHSASTAQGLITAYLSLARGNFHNKDKDQGSFLTKEHVDFYNLHGHLFSTK